MRSCRHGPRVSTVELSPSWFENAGVAQLAEQPICNRQVAGSSPIASSMRAGMGRRRTGFRKIVTRIFEGQMAERLMAADCKSAALTCYGGSNPSLPTTSRRARNGGQKPANFFPGVLSPRTPPLEKSKPAHVAQLVEHVLGKDGVSSSNLLVGSISGSNSGVESQPSKLLVAGSNPVSRSTDSGFNQDPTSFDQESLKMGFEPATFRTSRCSAPHARSASAASEARRAGAFGSRLPLRIENGVSTCHVN